MPDCEIQDKCQFPTQKFEMISQDVTKLVQRFEDLQSKVDKSLQDFEIFRSQLHETINRVTVLESKEGVTVEARLQLEASRSKLETIDLRVTLLERDSQSRQVNWTNIGAWSIMIASAIAQGICAYLVVKATGSHP